PYEEGVLAEIMRWIEGEGDIAENGILVLQHSVRETLQGSSGQKKMVVTDQRRYGDTMLTFLEKRCEE
ncbi:MAG: DNA methyltransferase, partial [Syntrophales bacterium LBB04]|nr:DNA methyltransferase [Syntrophales bacterium LBB04]